MGRKKDEAMRGSVIALMIVAALVVVVCCVGFYFFNDNISNVVNQFAESNMLTSVETKTQIVDEYIHGSEAILKTFAEAKELKDLLLDVDNKELRRKAQDYTHRYGEYLEDWEGLYLDTWDSVVLTHTNPEKLDYVMREGESLKKLQDEIYADREWVHNGGVVVAPISNTLVIPMYAPIFNEDYRILGFVGGALESSKLNNILNKAKIEGLPHAEYALIDTESGLYVFSENEKLINTVAKGDLVADIFEQIDNGVYTGTSRYTNEKGVEYVAVYKYMADRRWVFAIKDTAREIYSSAYEINSFRYIVILQYFLIISIVTLLIVVVLRELRTKSMLETINNRYQAVNTQALSIVYEYDFESDIVEMNGSCERIFGVVGSDVKLTFHEDFIPRIHPEDYRVVNEFLGLENEEDGKFNSELRFRDNDGQYRWYKLSAQVVTTRNGKKRIIGNFVNADEQIIMAHRLKRESETDLLTGLLNKVTMEKEVNTYLRNVADNDVAALFMIDLDNFKAVNDTLGHQMGDRAISSVAHALNLIFTENDYIARLGGDEYAVFICLRSRDREFSKNLIEEKAERIRTKLHMTFTSGHDSVNITTSIGITLYERGDTYQKLYERADRALYKSKEGGKDRFTYA